MTVCVPTNLNAARDSTRLWFEPKIINNVRVVDTMNLFSSTEFNPRQTIILLVYLSCLPWSDKMPHNVRDDDWVRVSILVDVQLTDLLRKAYMIHWHQTVLDVPVYVSAHFKINTQARDHSWNFIFEPRRNWDINVKWEWLLGICSVQVSIPRQTILMIYVFAPALKRQTAIQQATRRASEEMNQFHHDRFWLFGYRDKEFDQHSIEVGSDIKR